MPSATCRGSLREQIATSQLQSRRPHNGPRVQAQDLTVPTFPPNPPTPTGTSSKWSAQGSLCSEPKHLPACGPSCRSLQGFCKFTYATLASFSFASSLEEKVSLKPVWVKHDHVGNLSGKWFGLPCCLSRGASVDLSTFSAGGCQSLTQHSFIPVPIFSLSSPSCFVARSVNPQGSLLTIFPARIVRLHNHLLNKAALE